MLFHEGIDRFGDVVPEEFMFGVEDIAICREWLCLRLWSAVEDFIILDFAEVLDICRHRRGRETVNGDPDHNYTEDRPELARDHRFWDIL